MRLQILYINTAAYTIFSGSYYSILFQLVTELEGITLYIANKTTHTAYVIFSHTVPNLFAHLKQKYAQSIDFFKI